MIESALSECHDLRDAICFQESVDVPVEREEEVGPRRGNWPALNQSGDADDELSENIFLSILFITLNRI